LQPEQITMSCGPTTYEQKLGQCIRMLGSDREKEALAALHALRRRLEAAGEDLHDLANRIENANGAGISEAELQRALEQGIAIGLKRAESARHRQFHDISEAKDPWGQVADHCQQHRHRLSEREGKFVGGMVGLTREKTLTPKQAKWLLDIFRRLDGVLV
jgi:hypothetical protein